MDSSYHMRMLEINTGFFVGESTLHSIGLMGVANTFSDKEDQVEKQS
jgi:hypothetical protein